MHFLTVEFYFLEPRQLFTLLFNTVGPLTLQFIENIVFLAPIIVYQLRNHECNVTDITVQWVMKLLVI